MLIFLLIRLHILWLDTMLKKIHGLIGFILYMLCLIYLSPLISKKESYDLLGDYLTTDGMINSLSLFSNPLLIDFMFVSLILVDSFD